MLPRTYAKVGPFVAIFTILFCSFIFSFIPIAVSEVHAQDEKYEYYGYVPRKFGNII